MSDSKSKESQDNQWESAKAFSVSLSIQGIDKKKLPEIIRTLIFKSEIRDIHKISFWKILLEKKIAGMTILKNKWKRKAQPKLSVQYNNINYHCDVAP